MSGVDLIAVERERQIEEEGFDSEHDESEHPSGELAWAAVCYAAPEPVFRSALTMDFPPDPPEEFFDPWSLDSAWDKRQEHDRKRQRDLAGSNSRQTWFGLFAPPQDGDQ